MAWEASLISRSRVARDRRRQAIVGHQRKTPRRTRRRGSVIEGYRETPDTAEASLRAVFKVISKSVSPGQIEEVRGQLPEEMKTLFPSAA
jgi:uncharacterized protein (DUF2267 family)